MIEMRMGHDDRVDLLRGHGHVAPVAFAPFLRSLKQAAVDENLKAVLARRIAGINEVLRPRDGPGRA
jgi:hypothetical protein